MKQNRYLITRIDRIGDVVLSTPLPREIKKSDPNSFIAVLVRDQTKDIYLNNPWVDEIIVYDKSNKTNKPFWELVKEIRAYKFTHGFMLLPNERLNYILFLAGVKNRVGVGHKLYQFLTFTKYVDRKKYIPLRHEADYCLDMLRKFNLPVNHIYPEIYLTEEENNQALELKNQLKAKEKILIGVHTTSGNSSPNLSVSAYRKLIELLLKNENYEVLVTDMKPEGEIRNISGVKYIFDGTSLRSDIIKFSVLDVLISNSTGPMHICAALKVPTFSVFCTLSACSKELWGPLGNRSFILEPPKNYCNTQCNSDPKKCNLSGENGLTAEQVYNELKNFTDKLYLK